MTVLPLYRRNWIRRLAGIGIIAAMVLGCVAPESRSGGQKTVQPPPNPNVLRVGVSTNAPPLIYQQGGQILGLEAELAKYLGEYLGKSVTFVTLDWADQIPALRENRTDIIMSGMSITKNREVLISFTRPYFRTGQMALTHTRYLERIPQNYYGIRGMSLISRFGVVENTTGAIFVQENFGRAKEIVAYPTSKQAVADLLRDRIDLVIHDGPIILVLAAENENNGLAEIPTLLSEEYLAWGVRKNDVELLAAANGFIETMRAQNKLDPIIKRWIPFGK